MSSGRQRPGRTARRHVAEWLYIALGIASVSGVVLQLVPNQFAFLHFFHLPVAWAAWRTGRMHGVFAASVSVAVVFTAALMNEAQFGLGHDADPLGRWLDLGIWGAFLFVSAWVIALLSERDARRTRQLESAYHGILEIMSKFIDAVDRSTENHSRRVAERSVEVARAMGMEEDGLETLRVAAYLHDIGKVEVSTDLLNKASRLSPSEFAALQRHVDHGVDMLQRVGGLLEHAVPIVLYHHERWDGRGYKGLAGDAIPLGARIIAVADTYDAIVADRPYRRGRTHLEAVAILRAERGTQFDPAVVDVFLELYDQPVESEPAAAA